MFPLMKNYAVFNIIICCSCTYIVVNEEMNPLFGIVKILNFSQKLFQEGNWLFNENTKQYSGKLLFLLAKRKSEQIILSKWS